MKPAKRGRPSKGTSKLDSDSILHCAKALFSKDGKVPSLRLLAGELNVDPMAIYHYYKNKSSLLEALAISLIGDIYVPRGRLDWTQEIRALSLGYLELLDTYPGLLETLLSMDAMGPSDVFSATL